MNRHTSQPYRKERREHVKKIKEKHGKDKCFENHRVQMIGENKKINDDGYNITLFIQSILFPAHVVD